MQEEVEALHKNQTWKLVLLPPRRKTIINKWIYKIKRITMTKWSGIMQDWWLKDMLINKVLISTRFFL